MKTAEEIAERAHQLETTDFLGFQISTLVDYLPWELLQPFLKEGTKQEDVEDVPQPVSPEKVLFDLTDYMSFAWDKALGHRGISASRSISHYAAWMWILGDDEAYGWTQDDSLYPMYGVPILARISEKYGIPLPEGDDVERMRQGKRCSDDCTEC